MNDLGFGAAVAAFVLTCLLMWLLQPLARFFGLLDRPCGRKDHLDPTPVIGGLAMALGVIVVGAGTLTELGTSFAAFLFASVILIAVGLADDKYDLPWWLRLLLQVLASLVIVYVGDVRVEQLGPVFGLDSLPLGPMSVPFTVFATVGIINAINMSDGADGVAGLLVFVALLMLTGAAFYSGNQLIAERSMILGGAVGAFLLYNLRFPWQPKARLFMGNAGSMFLGLVIAWTSFRLTQNPLWHPVSPVLALWFIPIPIMDCLVLTVRRLRQGRSPFAADHNHIHHLMQEAAFGPTQAALVLALFSVACGLAASQALRLDIPEPLLLVAFFMLCVLWYWMTSRRARAVAFFRWIRRPGAAGRAEVPQGDSDPA